MDKEKRLKELQLLIPALRSSIQDTATAIEENDSLTDMSFTGALIEQTEDLREKIEEYNTLINDKSKKDGSR